MQALFSHGRKFIQINLILACIALAVFWPQWRAYLQGFGYPQVDSISPSSGPVGTIVAISGEHFGESLGTVTFGSQEATILFWNPTLIELIVPELEAGIYDVVVTTSVGSSNSVAFEIVTKSECDPPLHQPIASLDFMKLTLRT